MENTAQRLEWFQNNYCSPGEGLKAEILIEPSNVVQEFDRYALGVFAEARELCKRKEKDYGSAWNKLGARGLFVSIRIKYLRLFNLLWLGQAPAVAKEALRDTLIDMLNYILFTIYCIDTGNIDGSAE